MKKNVVIDFSRINDYTGFGEVARRYYAELCRVDAPDLHFIAIVPPDYTGVRSENIDYLTTGNELQDLQRLGLSADLWHTTDQRQHLSPRKSGAKRLLTIHDINFIGEKTGIHRLKRILKMKLKIMRSDYISVISQYVKWYYITRQWYFDIPLKAHFIRNFAAIIITILRPLQNSSHNLSFLNIFCTFMV